MAEKLSELPIWTIYRHPKDYPDCYVARRWLLYKSTDLVLLGRDLDAVRSLLPEGLHRIERDQRDDPCIVESWI